MITPEDLLEFLDREFRSQAKDTFLCHSLHRVERVEEFLCIPKAVLKEKKWQRGKDYFYFDLPSNPSKFREGDRVILSPHEENLRGKELRLRGKTFIFAGYDIKEKTLTLTPDSPGQNSLQIGKAYTLDTSLPQFFPTYSYASWGIGLLKSGLPQGQYLGDLLMGKLPDTLPALQGPPPPLPLQKKQEEAYYRAFSQPLSLIQGPPGTGKTYLLAALALSMASLGKRVLISALTHRAINNALNAILATGSPFEVVKASDALAAFDLNERATLVESSQDKKKFWHNLSRSSGPIIAGMTVYSAFRPFAVAMLRNFRKIKNQRPHRPKWISREFWHKVSRYVSTLCKISEWDTPETYFDIVIFDEASQLLIPHALLPMAHGKRFIFVGDHAQLPPIVTQDQPAPKVSRSIFEHFVDLYPQCASMLGVSFRMNRSLIHFPSRFFYQGKIKASPEAASRKFPLRDVAKYGPLFKTSKNVFFLKIDHQGALVESPVEAYLIADIACHLVKEGFSPADMAIIAPYRRQNNLIKGALKKVSSLYGWDLDFSELIVDTVERMQGQERELILVSLTVSEEAQIERDGEFLLHEKRFNVLITRAKTKLLVVGSPKIFRYVPLSPNLGQPWEMAGTIPFPHYLKNSRGVYPSREEDKALMEKANLFKGWYFERKEKGEVVDYTEEASQLYERIHGEQKRIVNYEL